MNIVKYDENSVLKFQNNLKKSNNEILDNIKLIDEELKNIKSILDTPNSSKRIPLCIESLEKMENLIDNYDKTFENIFNVVKDEYIRFLSETRETVGGKNG